MKILSFNVNGIRAISKKNFFEDMDSLNADIICLQETKASVEQVKETVAETLSSYYIYANQAEKKGYYGTAIFSKTEPISVVSDMGIEEHDQEGRVLAAEFENFYVVTVYVPNSKNDLSRLDYRQKWDADFLAYLKELEKKKPVISCGDFNVAHKEIDLARPKPNYNKSAGFTQKEIDGMDHFTQNGFVDIFRSQHPDDVKYSWWSYRGGARERNVGWRIDYFLISESLQDEVKKSTIENDILGSDHCPVGIEMS